MPVVSDPVVLLTEELQYPTVEFYDYDDQTTSIPQPSGRPLDARDERLRQVSYADGLLWTSGSPETLCWSSGMRHCHEAACAALCQHWASCAGSCSAGLIRPEQ